jgi:stage III sporulation protein AF
MEWLKNIVGYLLIISVAMQMLPGKKYEPYVRLFLGFFMLIFLLQPILRIRNGEQYLEQKIREFMIEQEALEGEIFLQSQSFQRESEQLHKETIDEIKIQEIEPVQVEVELDD